MYRNRRVGGLYLQSKGRPRVGDWFHMGYSYYLAGNGGFNTNRLFELIAGGAARCSGHPEGWQARQINIWQRG